jgi:hypothetical protein
VALGWAKQGKRKKKGRGRGEADRRGPVVSSTRKRKRKRRDWAAAGGSWWAGRPAGPKGKKVSFLLFLFFSKLFF